jgi:hypothetical protein
MRRDVDAQIAVDVGHELAWKILADAITAVRPPSLREETA